jgi:predicted transcriptional regulator of viral defense system
MVTTAQARSVRVTAQNLARMADQGVLARVRHGVYRVAGTSWSPDDDLRAASLALAPELMAHERPANRAPTWSRTLPSQHYVAERWGGIVEVGMTSRAST